MLKFKKVAELEQHLDTNLKISKAYLGRAINGAKSIYAYQGTVEVRSDTGTQVEVTFEISEDDLRKFTKDLYKDLNSNTE